MSVLSKNISYYPSISEPHKGIIVQLLKLLQSTKHQEVIEILRKEADPIKQKELKEKLPCFTVAGVFKGRSSAGLIMSSGLAAIDLDHAENYDALHLMKEFKKIPYIAYCGLSCRGQRLFLIAPFATDNYNGHYERLIESFEDMGLPMGDSCHKQISQPRYVSYNDENTCFYNHNAKAYDLLPKVKTYNYPKTNKQIFSHAPINPFQWCVEQINKSHSFTDGHRHEYIKHLARYCNLKGLTEDATINGCIVFQSEDFNENEIKGIIKYIYSKQVDSFNKIPFIEKKTLSKPTHD